MIHVNSVARRERSKPISTTADIEGRPAGGFRVLDSIVGAWCRKHRGGGLVNAEWGIEAGTQAPPCVWLGGVIGTLREAALEWHVNANESVSSRA
jgi:hypothetical protein